MTAPEPRRRLLLALPTLLAGATGRGHAAAPALDSTAPALAELRTLAGVPVLPEAPGPWRLLYLDFWASWCGPCRQSFPWMNALHERLGPRGLRIVAINLDREAQAAQRFLQQVPARFELAMDPAGDSARRYDIQAMPSSVLLNAQRRVLHLHRGFRPADAPVLEAQILAALERS